MKPRKLKEHIPTTPEEWLEYLDHRERWNKNAQTQADANIRKRFPVTDEDNRITENIRKHLTSSHSKKSS